MKCIDKRVRNVGETGREDVDIVLKYSETKQVMTTQTLLHVSLGKHKTTTLSPALAPCRVNKLHLPSLCNIVNKLLAAETLKLA